MLGFLAHCFLSLPNLHVLYLQCIFKETRVSVCSFWGCLHLPLQKSSAQFGEFVAEGCCQQQSPELPDIRGFKGNAEKELLPVQHNLWNLHKNRTLVQTAKYPFTFRRLFRRRPWHLHGIRWHLVALPDGAAQVFFLAVWQCYCQGAISRVSLCGFFPLELSALCQVRVFFRLRAGTSLQRNQGWGQAAISSWYCRVFCCQLCF